MSSLEQPLVESVITNQFGESYFYSINGDALSQQSAHSLYKNRYDSSLFDDDTYYVIAGTDSGLLIEYIVNQGIPNNTKYLFIELPQYIDLIRPELNDEWQEVLKFCTPEQWAQEYDHNNAAAYFYNTKVRVLYSIAVSQAYNNKYQQLRVSVEDIFNNRTYENNVKLGNYNFIRHQLLNVSHNINSIKCLDNIFEGKTCVILGGGPSLNEHLEWVVKNKDKLIIIAVSRISKKLQEYGLIPHIVCVIDPQQVSYDVSKEVLEYPPEVLMLSSFHVHPKIVSQWSGLSVYYGNKFPWDSENNALEHYQEGPTVVNSALIAAVQMGCKEILLTGSDLSYASDGKTHTSGSYESRREIELSRASQWHDNYAGEKVETIVPLILTGKYLSKHALYAKEHNCSVYNLSITALKIDDIPYKSVLDIKLDHLNVSPVETIKNNVPNFSLMNMSSHLAQTKKEFDRVKSDLKSINLLAHEAIRATHKLFSVKSSEKLKLNTKLKLDDIDQQLSTKYHYLNGVLKALAIREFTKILMGGSAKNLNNEGLIKRNITYYQSFIIAVELLNELLVPAQNRLAIFKNSYSTKPDISKLCEYWKHHKEFSCVKIFKQRMFEIINTPPLLDIINLKEFEEKQSIYHDEIDGIYEKVAYSLDGVADKIRLQFSNKDSIGLTKIIKFLSQSNKDKRVVKSYTSFAYAYLNLLENKPELAFDYFSQVSEDFMSPKDIEQQIFLMVLLEKFDEAEKALGSICDVSPHLLKLYGQVLKRNKKQESAIEIYSRYLEKFNSDIAAWCELAELFVQCNMFESAQMAYQFIVNVEPDHKQALLSLETINQYLATKLS